MWNYPYENGYDIYSNCEYNLMTMKPNVNSGYGTNMSTEQGLVDPISSTFNGDYGLQNFNSCINEIVPQNKSKDDNFTEYVSNFNNLDNYQNDIAFPTKGVNYLEKDNSYNLNGINGQSNDGNNPELFFDPAEQYHTSSKHSLNGKEDNKKTDESHSNTCSLLNPNSPAVENKKNHEQDFNSVVSNSPYNYDSYTETHYDTWDKSNDKMVGPMNDTYYWDSNMLNNGYFNGLNGMTMAGYDYMGYNTNNSPNLDQYNMTQDPYTMNYMKNMMNNYISNGYNLEYGSISSPNEPFADPYIKYNNKMYNNNFSPYYNQMPLNANLNVNYNCFNKLPQLKQSSNPGLEDCNSNNNAVNQFDMLPNNFESVRKPELISLDDEALESFIYNGNIKKIDISNIDFINMSDKVWQALRGAGLFKLGNKGRAILKSKISKYLKMYPELRMRYLLSFNSFLGLHVYQEFGEPPQGNCFNWHRSDYKFNFCF
ncbi:hypothetical protein TpMuguga_01g00258 [Theileria parva strain Muguga]|uniref:Uncharacterized protein n=1 Tax=Theileria parva TaxID=5875 RepID=Q4N956_THEPA|nr:uncharacterized protein TpMuguga_01g00258 [Theileria parva strain Muguga]EAN33502.1 hypothetical protein TpMuguga_01g00258 [Theileria parva strain Muguga]|eukprot:XP_765785.1 hypothetical protein [Theileria parva strain Muguga]